MRKIVLGAVLGLALLPRMLTAQDSRPEPPSRERIVAAARELMAGAGICTFVTVGDGGQPFARVVDPLPPDADLTVWIGTNPATRKVAQIRKNPKAALLCFDSARGGYVTLMGAARLVTDRAEKARHWKEEWADFYPGGPESDSYLLVQLVTERIELLSSQHGLVADRETWRPVILELRPER